MKELQIFTDFMKNSSEAQFMLAGLVIFIIFLIIYWVNTSKKIEGHNYKIYTGNSKKQLPITKNSHVNKSIKNNTDIILRKNKVFKQPKHK